MFRHETHPLLGKPVICELHQEWGPGKCTYADSDKNKCFIIWGEPDPISRCPPSDAKYEYCSLDKIKLYESSI